MAADYYAESRKQPQLTGTRYCRLLPEGLRGWTGSMEPDFSPATMFLFELKRPCGWGGHSDARRNDDAAGE